MKYPLVTVGIPTYNHSKFLPNAIDSVLSQRYQNLELFIFDNASTDDTREVCKAYDRFEEVEYFCHPENIGMAKNWNSCLTTGAGEYIAILGADDEMMPNHLMRMVDLLERYPDAGLCHCPAWWIHEDGTPDKVMRLNGHPTHPFNPNRNEVAGLLMFDDYVCQSSIVYRRSAVEGVGLFRNVVCCDYEHIVRCAAAFPFAFDEEPTLRNRRHAGQDSQRFYQSTDPLEGHQIVTLWALRNCPDRLAGLEGEILHQSLWRMQLLTGTGRPVKAM